MHHVLRLLVKRKTSLLRLSIQGRASLHWIPVKTETCLLRLSVGERDILAEAVNYRRGTSLMLLSLKRWASQLQLSVKREASQLRLLP
jgi:hypothetical protein